MICYMLHYLFAVSPISEYPAKGEKEIDKLLETSIILIKTLWPMAPLS